ncbi:MAG: glycerol-3-phosphate dehydrogenase/oxidase [Candidatus Eiseniibacteriota bacterium]
MRDRVDVLVVGGGIHGACVARDAATRGLTVALLEQADLASGTSSRSSKLIHGGLRYLETGQFGLVREALAERSILLATAPHLVRPQPFLLPFDGRGGRPEWLVRFGLTLYDQLARRSGRSGRSGLPRHRWLGPAEALALEPGLPPEGLRGAALFHDAQMDDARLVVANAVAAGRAGADIRTRTRVTGLESLHPEGSGWRALTDHGEAIEARVVVNAAGPWADAMRRLASPGCAPALRPTRGTHVVVPRLTHTHALLLLARRDRRVFFVVPWGSRSLVGTTDVDHAGPPEGVSPATEDVRYLWDEIAARWPERSSSLPSETGRVFAGLRSLVRTDSRVPWRNTREARMLEERGVLTLVGGKFTTARRLAERTVDRVIQLAASGATTGTGAARTVGPCRTATDPLPGGEERERAIRERAQAKPGIVSGLRQAEVAYAVDCEFARSIADVLWRRTGLWLDRHAALSVAETVADWMAPVLGWSPAERATQLEEFRAECAAEERWIAEAAFAP